MKKNGERILEAKRCPFLFSFLLLLTLLCNVECSDAKMTFQEGTSMNKWNLGRLDFSLPEQFEIIGRYQSIYSVIVKTSPLQNTTAVAIWNKRLKEIRSIHLANGYSSETLRITEINPGFPAVFYHENSAAPKSVTLEAHKPVPGNVLKLSFTGKIGAKNDMLRLISLTAEDYRPGVWNGFSVGSGSLIGPPSKYEHARATFKDKKTKTVLKIHLHTAGRY